jgi:hypothetical protein
MRFAMKEKKTETETVEAESGGGKWRRAGGSWLPGAKLIDA